MVQFISLIFSPWSEKARWALDHHRVAYQWVRYQPLLSEPGLRLSMRKWRGKISAPLLRTDDGYVTDSFEIARWADAHGSGTPLFTDPQAVARFNTLSEEGLGAARALGLTRMLKSTAGLATLLPRPLRGTGPLGTAIARFGVKRTLRKYGAHHLSLDDHREVLHRTLTVLRSALAKRESSTPVRTLLPSFSYADIAAAQILQFVAPKNLGGLRMAEAGQRAYRDEALVSEFADLIEWRDALYAAHRPSPAMVESAFD